MFIYNVLAGHEVNVYVSLILYNIKRTLYTRMCGLCIIHDKIGFSRTDFVMLSVMIERIDQ